MWLLWTARSRVAGVAVGVVALVQAATLPFALIDTGHGVGWIAQSPRHVRVSQAVAEWGVSILYRRTTIRDGLLGGAVLLALVGLLLVFGGDRRTRRGAGVAAAIAGFVWGAPLVLGVLSRSEDYFLSRNVIPAVVPLAVLLGAACVVPRLRLLGGALAVALVALFSYATIQVQTHGYLQRPDWRSVAHALGPATVPRAIVAANGLTADPAQDLPGALELGPAPVTTGAGPGDRRGRGPQAASAPAGSHLPTREPPIWLHPKGAPTPALVAPPGSRLLDRFVVRNWIVGRFVFDHPTRVSVKQLIGLAPEYFHRTPKALLIFFQRPPR